MDFFLDDNNKDARVALEKLVGEGSDNDAKIYQLVREVLREFMSMMRLIFADPRSHIRLKSTCKCPLLMGIES